jgi:hypothetical protein
MNTPSPETKSWQFYRPRWDIHFNVEVIGDDVTIRTTRREIPVWQRRAFIHELTSEGFIDERFEFGFNPPLIDGPGIVWVVDSCWLTVPEIVTQSVIQSLWRLWIAGASGLFLLLILVLANS